MKKSRRFIFAFLVLVFAGLMFFLAYTTDNIMYSSDKTSQIAEGEVIDTTKGQIISDDMDTLLLYYTDEALTDYLTTECLLYQADNNVRVTPVLMSGVEFLEQVNTASILDGEEYDGVTYQAPDLYITSHDNLMKAYYAGLATEITDPKLKINELNYPETALHAVTCDGKYVGYPLYYETNFLLYNKTYMANIAKNRIDFETGSVDAIEAQEGTDEEADSESSNSFDATVNNEEDSLVTSEEGAESEASSRNAEADSENGDPMGDESVESDPEVLERLATIIPSTIDDIRTFANNYDAPEEVEAVFKWDVSDIFYNYFFAGNYMDVGGEDGDKNTDFNIYNQQTVDCLTVYQELNQFFSIDSDEVSYDSVIQDFLEGKIVFTVATTDAIAKIESAKAAGNFNYEYGVAVLPDISDTLKARGLSVTNAVAVNGYSGKKALANDFADYIAYDKADGLYNKAGKIACKEGVDYNNSEIGNIMAEYRKSVPLPKMVEATNFWVQLEIAFTEVWNGADPNETLKKLSDTIGSQIDSIEYHTPIQESISIGVD